MRMVERVINYGLILLLCGFSATVAQDDATEIDKYFYNKCYRIVQTTDAFNNLKYSADHFIKALEYSFTFLPKEKKQFCSTERPQLMTELTKVTENLKPCLYKEELYLTNFIQESFKEFLHFLCHNNGENSDLFFSVRGQRCQEAIQQDGSASIANCFNRIFSPIGVYPKKKELCDDFDVAKKCFAQIIDSKCSSFTNFKNLNEKFFEYIRKPCNGCGSNAVNFILLLSSLFYFFYSKFF